MTEHDMTTAPRETNEREEKPPVLTGLVVGSMLHLSHEGRRPVRCLFVGMEYGRYLLVKVPPPAAIGRDMFEKNRFLLSYVHGGHLFGFRSTLLGQIREVVRLSVFSYPEALEVINLRRERRFPCLIEGVLNANPTRHAKDDRRGTVTDISRGGCRFESPEGNGWGGLKVGQSVSLSLNLPPAGDTCILAAEVRSLHTDGQETRLGLRFLTPADEDQNRADEILSAFLAALAREMSLPSG